MPRPLAIVLTTVFAFSTFATDAPVATVLSYHEVEPGGVPPHGTRPRPGADPTNREEQVRFTISVENFTKQLDYLKTNDYTIVPLRDVVDLLEGRRSSLPPKAVAITVDDGWLCTYTQIFPIMRARNLPFTAFVYPQIISKGGHYLTWAQVEEMSRAGVDIESHSYSHPSLSMKNDGTVTADARAAFLRHELLDSRTAIESHTRKPVTVIAFPYSDYDQAVIDASKQYGYEAAVYDREQNAFVTRNTPPMHIRRLPVRHDTTLEQFSTYFVK